jgi:hypothetical protein
MGQPGLLGALFEQIPGRVYVVTGDGAPEAPPLDVLLFDANGDLHGITRELHITDPAEVAEELLLRYGRIVWAHKPAVVVLCIDGGAAQSKLLLQANRRLGAHYENAASGPPGLAAGEPPVGFSASMLSPATEFMCSVDAAVRAALPRFTRDSQDWACVQRVVFSGHEVSESDTCLPRGYSLCSLPVGLLRQTGKHRAAQVQGTPASPHAGVHLQNNPFDKYHLSPVAPTLNWCNTSCLILFRRGDAACSPPPFGLQPQKCKRKGAQVRG